MPLDIALRRLLAQFRLPGEAQKIDRIMEKVRLKLWAPRPSCNWVRACGISVLNPCGRLVLQVGRLNHGEGVRKLQTSTCAPHSCLKQTPTH